ncbi:TPA: helix-turn-helix transcriptional regulator [Candidatus Galligastranaerophilus intestinavium]|uniref:Helix-turn-helix transcriptional regulator n=1 Tax=Candidatus Galligastranaerophilus intestinavium TaxID=2840836 RepID=A0A9D1FK46_9BACT|nr:helix-turn-helix transcriptional regulator [Candidatus Galligastranaerophilus intestinavium]
MTEFQKQFANKLKEIRIASGLSQEKLAEKLGVATKTVSYWENGHNAVTFNKIPLIAKALNVPVYKLFVFGDILSGDDDEISELINSLTERERLCISKVIKAILALK